MRAFLFSAGQPSFIPAGGPLRASLKPPYAGATLGKLPLYFILWSHL